MSSAESDCDGELVDSQLNDQAHSLVSRLCDEYFDALLQGVAPSIDAIVARHPQLRSTLEPALNAVKSLVSLSKHAPTPGAGSRLGDFFIERMIAQGGMGVVYEAKQLSLERKVALKVLVLSEGADESSAAAVRFENEIRAAASLDHPHIVPIHAFERLGKFHYYAMRLIDGQDWRQWLVELEQSDPAARCDSFIEIAKCVRDVATALNHAHSRGVVHRDIKPSNLLRDIQHHVWIVDFGLAHFPEAASLTLTGELVGTLRYMSPEQTSARVGRVDERADIYSLGATFYEMLTGKPTVTADSANEQLRQIIAHDFPPPRQHDERIPRRLETIVLKMLAHDVDDRYQMASEVVSDLENFLENRPIKARRPSRYQLLIRWSRKRAGALLVVSAVLASFVLILAMLAGQLQSTRRNLQRQLVLSRVAEAQAHVTSRAVGQRFQTLDSISKATANLDHSTDQSIVASLRQTAATALSLGDTQTTWEIPREPGGSLDSVVFDKQLTVATQLEQGQLNIVECSSRQTVATLPEIHALTVVFSNDGTLFSALCGSEEQPTIEWWNWKQQLRLWQRTSDSFPGVPRRFATDVNAITRQTAVGTDTGHVCLLDEHSGTTIREFTGPAEPIGQVKFSNNGKWIAASYVADRVVKIWEVESGRQLANLRLSEDTFAIAWSADDRKIAIGNGFDVHVFGGQEWGSEVAALRGPTEIIANIFLHPSGRCLAAYGYDGKTRIWDLDAQVIRLEISGHAHHFSPDGRSLAFRTYDTQGIWEFAFDDVVWHQTDRKTIELDPDAVCFLNSDRWLAVSGSSGCHIWNVYTRERLVELTGTDVTDVFPLHDSKAILVCCTAGIFRIRWEQLEHLANSSFKSSEFPWTSLKPEKLDTPESARPLLIAASSSGDVIAATTTGGGVIARNSNAPSEWFVQDGRNYRHISMSENGEFIAASEVNSERTTIWHLPSRKHWEIGTREGGDITVATVEKTVQLLTSEHDKYCVWQLATQEPPTRMFQLLRPSGYQKSATAYCPSIGWLVAMDRTSIAVMEPATGRVRLNLKDGYQTHRSLIIRGDATGRLLAVANGSNGFLVWEMPKLNSKLTELGLNAEQ